MPQRTYPLRSRSLVSLKPQPKTRLAPTSERLWLASEDPREIEYAVKILAAERGLAVQRVDLRQVKSKYIGETEKNLARVLDQAERKHALLFFDEADALFGKRTDVKDSHDRFTNAEVNYLLQRIERSNTTVVFATRRKTNLDDPFVRRLR